MYVPPIQMHRAAKTKIYTPTTTMTTTATATTTSTHRWKNAFGLVGPIESRSKSNTQQKQTLCICCTRTALYVFNFTHSLPIPVFLWLCDFSAIVSRVFGHSKSKNRIVLNICDICVWFLGADHGFSMFGFGFILLFCVLFRLANGALLRFTSLLLSVCEIRYDDMMSMYLPARLQHTMRTVFFFFYLIFFTLCLLKLYLVFIYLQPNRN